MLKKTTKPIQPSLFQSQLEDMLDSKDPRMALADTLPWEQYETSFEKYYSDEGRPAKPIRLMVGLLLLKQLKSLSNEEVML